MFDLTPHLQSTFSVLANPSNLASLPVLIHALNSSHDEIRHAAIKACIARGRPEDFGVILNRIDRCNEADVAILSLHKSLILSAVEAGLADRDPLRNQQAIIAIGKLALDSLYPHLIRVVEDFSHPQQTVAIEILMSLAIRLGTQARDDHGKASESRETLVVQIEASLDRFEDHRVRQVVDAWLASIRWDDVSFRAIWTDRDRFHIQRLVAQQLKTSTRPYALALCAGVLWGRDAEPAAMEIVLQRQDHPLLEELSAWIDRVGVTSTLKKNFANIGFTLYLSKLDFGDEQIPIPHRAPLLQLLPLLRTSPDRMIGAVNQLLQEADPRAHPSIIRALRAYRQLTPEMTVMAMSDGLDAPNPEDADGSPMELPPWKDSLRRALQELFRLYPLQPESVQDAIEYLFASFTCDELLQHLEKWSEPHLKAYATVLRVSKDNWLASIEREFRSQSGRKRSHAMRALRLIGLDESLTQYAVDALNDGDDRVREEGVLALADGRNRDEAIELIHPMLHDVAGSVQSAAKEAVDKLKRSKIISTSGRR